MKKHLLTPQERLRGVEGALRSRKTPRQLRPGLRAYRDRLRHELGLPAIRRGRASKNSPAKGE